MNRITYFLAYFYHEDIFETKFVPQHFSGFN